MFWNDLTQSYDVVSTEVWAWCESRAYLNFEKASHTPFAPKNELELQVGYTSYICFNFDL